MRRLAVATVLLGAVLTSVAEYPEGCVSCHVAETDRSADFRIHAMLKQMDHEAFDDVVALPGDCATCHSKDEPPDLGALIHVAHYDESHRNGFVQEYKGDCLHCHAMNADEGESDVKSGEKNW